MFISTSLLDCSQPSIFSYVYSIFEHAHKIARELDTSAKTNGWRGSDEASEKSFSLCSLSFPPTLTPSCSTLASLTFSLECVEKWRGFEQSASPLVNSRALCLNWSVAWSTLLSLGGMLTHLTPDSCFYLCVRFGEHHYKLQLSKQEHAQYGSFCF